MSAFFSDYLQIPEGSKLTISGAFTTTLTVTGTTALTLPVSGTVLSTLNIAANAVSSIAGTANQIAVSASTGAVTVSVASGRGLAQKGFTTGSNALAATPDFIGQSLVADDGFWGFAYGAGPGAIANFATVTNGVTYLGQSVQLNDGTFTVTNGYIRGIGADTHQLTIGGGLFVDNVLDIQNSSTGGHSTIAFWKNGGTVGNTDALAVGLAPASSSADYAGKAFLSTSPPSGSPTDAPHDIGLYVERNDGSSYVAHRMLLIDATNKTTTIYGYTNNTAVGPVGLFINGSGDVAAGTSTPASSAKLTVAGRVTLNGSSSALVVTAQSGSDTMSFLSSDGTNFGFTSSVNGAAFNYSKVTGYWTAIGYTATDGFNIGGATSSFPGIRRSGTTARIRLADDSDFADLAARSSTITQSTLGSAVQTLTSVATNDDPTEIVRQNRVATTDATTTTIATVAIPATTTVLIEARVTARRTGGSSGTAEDGAAYIVCAAYKNVAGTATEIGETSIFSAEDQAAWAVTVTPSSGNALIQVAGAANNNVTWHITYRTYSVST